MHGQVSEGGMQEGAYAVSQTLRVVARARKRCRAPGLRVSYHGALLWCSFDLVHGLYGFSDLLEGSACVASRQDCWDFTPVFGGSLIRQICTGSTSKSSVGDGAESWPRDRLKIQQFVHVERGRRKHQPACNDCLARRQVSVDDVPACSKETETRGPLLKRRAANPRDKTRPW